MQILFDLQEELKDYGIGEFEGSEYIVPSGDILPKLAVRVIDDVKTILVTERSNQVSGMGVHLSALKKLRTGDRITVTGRVPRESPSGSWGVALQVEDTASRRGEECQLSQYTSPKSLFALSHVLSDADLDCLLTVQTTRWGAINPIMDLYIDSILISRDGRAVEEDTRDIVYSFEVDENLQPGGGIYSDSDFSQKIYSEYLVKSGNPDIKIFTHEDSKAMYVSRRAKDWDGVDLYVSRLGLIKGNKYEITVNGSIDGYAPEGTIITLQGIPGYSWRNNQNMESNQIFTLRHILSDAEVEKWTTIRITTNTVGAAVPFYIYSIEIKRVGLL